MTENPEEGGPSPEDQDEASGELKGLLGDVYGQSKSIIEEIFGTLQDKGIGRQQFKDFLEEVKDMEPKERAQATYSFFQQHKKDLGKLAGFDNFLGSLDDPFLDE